LRIEKSDYRDRNDPFIDLSHIANKLGCREAKRIALKFDSDIQYTGNWNDNYASEYDNVASVAEGKAGRTQEPLLRRLQISRRPVEIERLKGAGYDGAIHIGNGETATSSNTACFDLRQVRSTLSGRSMFRRGGRTDFAPGRRREQ